MRFGRTMTGVLTTLGVAASAQGPARDPMRMDVAGVRLAMPEAQAKAAATAAGYACAPFGRSLTFDELVRQEVAARKGAASVFPDRSGTTQLDCRGPGGEALRLRLAQLRGGAVVDGIVLSIDRDRSDVAAVRRQLAARYGHPAVGAVMPTTWCDVPRCAGPAGRDGPSFTIDTMGFLSVRAERGRRAAEADAAAVQAAADLVAPKRRGAAL